VDTPKGETLARRSWSVPYCASWVGLVVLGLFASCLNPRPEELPSGTGGDVVVPSPNGSGPGTLPVESDPSGGSGSVVVDEDDGAAQAPATNDPNGGFQPGGSGQVDEPADPEPPAGEGPDAGADAGSAEDLPLANPTP
jgi:hypothetical protein